jgi:hypothetical protein
MEGLRRARKERGSVLAPFSLGGRSAAKIGTECLVYNRDESC